jgi:hypothetical protein
LGALLKATSIQKHESATIQRCGCGQGKAHARDLLQALLHKKTFTELC